MTWAPVLTLGEIAQGGVFTDGDWVESKDQDPSGTVRLTQLADVGVSRFRDRSDRWLREDQAQRLKCTFLRPHDLLIARMPDPIGRACLVPHDIGRAVTVVDVAVLRATREDIDSRYVMWAINSPRVQAEIERLQSGTTRKRISRKNLATIKIPLPELRAQRRIVEILEDHLSRLDAGLASVHDASLRAKALVWSCAADALTELRDSPVAALGSLAVSVKNGLSISRPGSEVSGVPILRISAVRPLVLDVSDLRYSARDAASLGEADALLKGGDVLFTRYNGNRAFVGACASVPQSALPLTYPDKLIRLRPSSARVLGEFLAIACSVGGGRAQIQGAIKTTAGQSGISGRDLKAVNIPVPSLDQQRVVIERVAAAREATALFTASTAAVAKRSAALRRALLGAAFSGQLTGRDSDIERAEELVDA